MRVHRRLMKDGCLMTTCVYDAHMEITTHMGMRLGYGRLLTWYYYYIEATVGAPIGGVHFEEVV